MNQYIIEYYQMGLYTIKDMEGFVQVGWLTKEEFKQTTGQDYDQLMNSQAPASTAPATSQASTATSQVSSASSVTA